MKDFTNADGGLDIRGQWKRSDGTFIQIQDSKIFTTPFGALNYVFVAPNKIKVTYRQLMIIGDVSSDGKTIKFSAFGGAGVLDNAALAFWNSKPVVTLSKPYFDQVVEANSQIVQPKKSKRELSLEEASSNEASLAPSEAEINESKAKEAYAQAEANKTPWLKISLWTGGIIAASTIVYFVVKAIKK